MNKVIGWIFKAALVLSLFLHSGCMAAGSLPVNSEPAMGQLYSLTNAITKAEVLKTLNSGAQGFVMVDPNGWKYVFFWPLREGRGTAFWAVDVKQMLSVANRIQAFKFVSGLSGQVANCVDTSCMVDWLRSNGWKIVGGTELSENARFAITTIVSASKSLPTFIVLPSSTDTTTLNGLFPEPIQQ